MTARKTWVSLACYLLLASTAFAEHHWAVGCWPTGSWSGVCIRPDGVVTESDPDGNLIDIGRWVAVDGDTIMWLLIRTPMATYMLERDGTYTVHWGYGYPAKPIKIRRGKVPEEFEGLMIIVPPPEPVLDFPEDWK